MWNWDADAKVIRDGRSWYSHHNIPPCLLKTWPQSAGASVPWLVRVVPWLVVWPLVCNIAISCADYRNISIFAASHHADFCIFNLPMRGGEDVFLIQTHPFTTILVILWHNLLWSSKYFRCVQKLKFKRVNCFHRKSRKGLCILVSNPLTIIRFGSGFLVLEVENTNAFQYILNIFNVEISSR